ncbi:Diphosphomevalonate decarboxylase [Trinorchestia longiramus]|nr:Diphosphomevalonate decarboxylase [Trinorchestia longiramus]
MAAPKYFIVTATAPVNIAVIKYWGKRDEVLILPLNDSISFTLSQAQLCATTTACISPAFTSDAFWLNGKEESLENPRIQNCLKEIRRRAKEVRCSSSDEDDCTSWHVHICSANNFPTAAGLASSAAGYAAMVVAVAEVYGVVGGDLSIAARQGSGSACRSVLGGLVRWYKGEQADGSDSVARQIAAPDHFGELHVILCVVSGRRKKTGSTEGMRRCVKTSVVMNMRLTSTVEQRTKSIMKAIAEKDWSSFCDLTMSDSQEMHAACMTACPPLMYMTDTSHAVVELVHEYNKIVVKEGQPSLKICYTFDAGPNACLFVPAVAVGQVTSLLLKAFPPSDHCTLDTYMRGLPSPTPQLIPSLEALSNDLINSFHSANSPPGIKLQYMLHTTVGEGPRIIAKASHNNSTGSEETPPRIGAATAAATAATTTTATAAAATTTASAATTTENSSGVTSSCHLIDPLTGKPIFCPPIS